MEDIFARRVFGPLGWTDGFVSVLGEHTLPRHESSYIEFYNASQQVMDEILVQIEVLRATQKITFPTWLLEDVVHLTRPLPGTMYSGKIFTPPRPDERIELISALVPATTIDSLGPQAVEDIVTAAIALDIGCSGDPAGGLLLFPPVEK